MMAKITGALGFLGVFMCGSTVIAWTLMLGHPQNYIGAILVAFLNGCAGLCCINAMMARKAN